MSRSPSFTLSAPAALYGGQGGSTDPSAFAETYTIDPWGNQQESGSFNFSQPFNSNNQVSASGYTYDTAGDLTGDALHNTYTYNVDGMLTASGSAQYTYDALNQRVSKTGGSYPTETIYFLGSPIAFHNPSSGAYTDLIYAGGWEIATVPGTQTATPTFRLLDHEGSLVMTTNASGTVTGSNVLSPYGETISSNTTDAYSYAGLYQDTEYGGDAATFRNYTAEQLRWTRPDPYNGSYDVTNPQSMNRYTYVMDNPLAMTDPSGLDCVTASEDGSVTITSGDCPGIDPNNEYYMDCSGCLMNVTSAYINPYDGNLVLNDSDGNEYLVGGDSGFGYTTPDLDDSMGMSMLFPPNSTIWSSADTNVHGLAIATAAVAAVPFVAPVASPAAVAARSLILNPSTWTTVGDFASGATPASLYPPTYAAAAGAVGSWFWDHRHR